MSIANRRSFLKNTSLAALGAAVLPHVSPAQTKNEKGIIGCIATTRDLYGEGPFYTENPPELIDGVLTESSEEGVKLIISGRVMMLDCSEFIEGAVVDIWHADDNGDYDNQGYNLRGKVTTNSEGFYLFETIKPGKYLNGGQYRPSHIHFKITPPNSPTLTTQLYFAGDEDIPGDAAASVNSGVYNATERIITLFDDGNEGLEGVWDIVLDSSGANGMNEIHLDKGVIYKTHPNPFTEELTISYGVFKDARASLLVFNMKGEQLANLEEQVLSAKKYESTWRPKASLANGHYFVCLKINDLQVHYTKVQKISSYGY